jgi:hypothetical protein
MTIVLIWKRISDNEVAPLPEGMKSERDEVTIVTYISQRTEQRCLASVEFPLRLIPWSVDGNL